MASYYVHIYGTSRHMLILLHAHNVDTHVNLFFNVGIGTGDSTMTLGCNYYQLHLEYVHFKCI